LKKVNSRKTIAISILQSNIKISCFKSQKAIRQSAISLFDKNKKQNLIKFEKIFLKKLNIIACRYYLVYLTNSKKYKLVQKVFLEIRFNYKFYTIACNKVTRLYKN